MAYQINKTDGTIIATVADGQIDDQSTDITLIGKNYSGFGESLNENFVKILENFANISQPESPIAGQLWYDTSELKLKVYTGSQFLPVSSASIVQGTPTTLVVGDFWYNELDRQLYFYDGSSSVLVAPIYSQAQEASGFIVRTVFDTSNQERVVTLLFSNGVLLGIFSNQSFTPRSPIDGYSGIVNIGFTPGNLENFKFYVTCINAEQLNGIDSSLYLRSDLPGNTVQGQFIISSNVGLQIGNAGQATLGVRSGGNVYLSNTAPNQKIIVETKRDLTSEKAIDIDAFTRTIEFFPEVEGSQANFNGGVLVAGDVEIRGRLTINDGDSTLVKTSELLVEDRIIQLAQTGDSSRNTDDYADGGGIILVGATEHIFLWSKDGQPASGDYPALASRAWTSSEHINLAAGKKFKIDGNDVVDENAFYGTSIPNVTSFGAQRVIDVGPDGVSVDPPSASTELRILNNRISTVKDDLDLELSPDGTGNVVLLGSPKITGMADPTNAQDAATKEYVDRELESRTIFFSIDLSDSKSNSYIITNILNNLAPPAEYRAFTQARILCSISTLNNTSLEINPLYSDTLGSFLTDLVGSTASAITNISFSTATITAPSITVTRILKFFSITGGVWSFDSELVLPP